MISGNEGFLLIHNFFILYWNLLSIDYPCTPVHGSSARTDRTASWNFLAPPDKQQHDGHDRWCKIFMEAVGMRLSNNDM